MLEKHVEKHLKKRVKEMGGMSFKFVSPGVRNVPDQIVMLPGARIAFFELKKPGEGARATQARLHDKMRRLDVLVYVCDSPDTVERALADLANRLGVE